MEKQTKTIRTSQKISDAYGALNMPVYNSAAYSFPSAKAMADAFVGRTDSPTYSRVSNPTVAYFEERVAQLSGAKHVFAFNSGMAAISCTLFALAASGKNIVTSAHLFGNTVSLLTNTLGRFGVETRFVDLLDSEAVANAIDDNTACVFLEIITNPQLEVVDIQSLSSITKKRNIPLVADTTIIPFTQFSAEALGVDIEVLSSTKYISGGATTLGGLVLDYGNFPQLYRYMKFELLYNIGSYMTPQVAFMQTLGLETLDMRYRTQANNALELARRLKQVPKIIDVNYVGLSDNVFHTLAKAQFGGTFGAMLTIDLEDKQHAFAFIDNLKLISRATNLFDSKSLAIHPASTIFGAFAGSQRRAMNVRDNTVRLSIGLEDVKDLYNDIVQAVKGSI
ncbi:MAG: PLP-dependent transferase [Bacteroidales bacterium]|nr:PLP-dependent transferase [Bacteroidales bacterium]